MSSEIIILQEGYGYTDKDSFDRATGSSTLVIGKVKVIVDTGGPWEKEFLLTKLKENNMKPDDVDVVVGTHGHSDHIGNLNLFPKAKQIVGFDINIADKYLENNFKNGTPYVLVENEIEILPTPGHTHSCVSVVVYNAVDYGTVGICGDLFECEHDDGIWQLSSEVSDIQFKNRDMIIKMCDFIVPGHGPMFKVQK